LKEVSGLRLLSENKARNINHIIDALLLGQTTWMVTEYCGGGSVASLVGVHGYPATVSFCSALIKQQIKPTSGGLQEKWTVPFEKLRKPSDGYIRQVSYIGTSNVSIYGRELYLFSAHCSAV
jgi:serine/threonine protein kinase